MPFVFPRRLRQSTAPFASLVGRQCRWKVLPSATAVTAVITVTIAVAVATVRVAVAAVVPAIESMTVVTAVAAIKPMTVIAAVVTAIRPVTVIAAVIAAIDPMAVVADCRGVSRNGGSECDSRSEYNGNSAQHQRHQRRVHFALEPHHLFVQ
jgi:hypothetical protein